MPIELGSTLGTDIPMAEAKDLSLDLRKLRAKLLEVEVERFQELGTTCALAMHAAIQRTQPGMIEWQIAGALADETRRRAVTPTVVLIATDERVHHVRHPLPTNQTMKRYAMLVLCGRKNGLICSITRLVHYGALADDLRRRMYACAEVDAAMIAASQPGMTLGEMFMLTQDAYARVGFDGEWQLHHQGGIAGYAPRELLATPNEKTALAAGMVCAWNPSISGVKSEDSILVTEHGAPQILTQVPGWPTVPITVAGLTIPRPLIVENP
jgi:antitoxin VapB